MLAFYNVVSVAVLCIKVQRLLCQRVVTVCSAVLDGEIDLRYDLFRRRCLLVHTQWIKTIWNCHAMSFVFFTAAARTVSESAPA